MKKCLIICLLSLLCQACDENQRTPEQDELQIESLCDESETLWGKGKYIKAIDLLLQAKDIAETTTSTELRDDELEDLNDEINECISEYNEEHPNDLIYLENGKIKHVY